MTTVLNNLMDTPELLLSHVVAMTPGRVIGKGGGLPWHLPADLKLFRRLTTGHALIMGRRTHESIGKALPGRLNIIVSRRGLPSGSAADCVVCPDIPTALARAAAARGQWGDEVFIIGGGELYAATMPQTRRVYLTRLHREVEGGDTFYPALPPDFKLVRQEDHQAAGEGEAFTWEVWER